MGGARVCAASAIGLAACIAGPVARAAPLTVAVADFDYADSSGEVTDQRAAHAERLAALQADIVQTLSKTGHFTAVKLACPAPPCSVDKMTQAQVSAAANAQHAALVVFGGVHKISTLIQWGQVEVMDAASGKAVLSRTVTFRGDSDDAWRHAADYIAGMVAAAIQG
jgi:hypothetical protein